MSVCKRPAFCKIYSLKWATVIYGPQKYPSGKGQGSRVKEAIALAVRFKLSFYNFGEGFNQLLR